MVFYPQCGLPGNTWEARRPISLSLPKIEVEDRAEPMVPSAFTGNLRLLSNRLGSTFEAIAAS